MAESPSMAQQVPEFHKKDGKIVFEVLAESELHYSKEVAKFDFSGQTFFCTYWKPKSEAGAKALVFLSHGYAEYVSRAYDEVAGALATDGVMVFSHDHVGHGRTTGQRVQISGMDDYVKPVIAHVESVRKWPGLEGMRIFLFGHSLGGLISILALLEKQSLFSGFVASGPLVAMDPDLATPFMMFLARMVRSILPSFHLGKIDPHLVTRDKEFAKWIEGDPLQWHRGFRAQHSCVLFDACLYVQENLDKIRLPILVLQGMKDKLVAPSGAKLLVDKAFSTDKQLVEYPEAFHNMFVELADVKDDAISRVRRWVLDHSS